VSNYLILSGSETLCQNKCQFFSRNYLGQVVAVGTALPTASLAASAQQGPVMLTAKNLQCMRAILSIAHCHGDLLGSAWHMVLTTLQHLGIISSTCTLSCIFLGYFSIAHCHGDLLGSAWHMVLTTLQHLGTVNSGDFVRF
jgi:hypothetical protein